MRSPMGRVMVLSNAQTAAAPSAGNTSAVVMGGWWHGEVDDDGDADANVSSTPPMRRPATAHVQQGYRGERYSTLARIDAQNAVRCAPCACSSSASSARSRPGRGLRRHPLRDDAPRHLRDRRGELRQALGPTPTSRSVPDDATNKGVAIAAGRVVRGSRTASCTRRRENRELLWQRQIAAGASAKGSARRRRLERARLHRQGRRRLGIRPHDGVQVEDGAPAWHFD